MRLKPAGVGLFLLAAFVSLASADEANLNPSKDNTLFQQANPASQLSSGQGDLFVGRTNQDLGGPIALSTRRALVSFNLGAIPAGSTITAVSLTMRETAGNSGDRIVELHRLLQDWDEGASLSTGGTGVAAQNNDATWLYTKYNSSNPGASPLWTTAGGSYDSAISSSTLVVDDFGPNQFFTWSSVGNPLMVADVQGWLDNPASNFGWLLRHADESVGQTAKRFNSGESTAAPPVLSVQYTVPEPGTSTLAGCATLCLAGVGIARRRRIAAGH